MKLTNTAKSINSLVNMPMQILGHIKYTKYLTERYVVADWYRIFFFKWSYLWIKLHNATTPYDASWTYSRPGEVSFLRLCKRKVPCSGLVWFFSVIQEIYTKNKSNKSRTILSLSFTNRYPYQSVLRGLNYLYRRHIRNIRGLEF